MLDVMGSDTTDGGQLSYASGPDHCPGSSIDVGYSRIGVDEGVKQIMTGKIYLLDNDSELVALKEAPYDAEKTLQELLAKHPDLLAGEQIDSQEPRRWLLVSREMSVASDDDGPARWSLDHLFLNQDAVPTLVEVKRSSDSRIRREVVGQMLDYAANAVVHWPLAKIKAKFEARSQKMGNDPDEILAEFTETRTR